MNLSKHIFSVTKAMIITWLLLGLAPMSYAQGSGLKPSQQETGVAEPSTLTVQVIPPIAGVQFALNGKIFQSQENGLAQVTAPGPGTYKIELLSSNNLESDNFRAEFQRWEREVFSRARMIDIPKTTHLSAGFEVAYPIDLKFVDLTGNPIDTDRITSVAMRGSSGETYTFTNSQQIWLKKNRIVRRLDGLDDVDVKYAIQSVQVDGSNVVNQGQQRFTVDPGLPWQIGLLLFTGRFEAEDAVFGFHLGDGVEIQYPDGRTRQFSFGPDGELSVAGMARGTYMVRVIGAPGISLVTPVVLSRNQEVELQVFSYLTITLAIVFTIISGLALLALGRPRFRWIPRRDAKRLLWFLIPILLLSPGRPAQARGVDEPPDNPIPVFAYYYIWFDENSWARGKTDYPILGRYSSDDPAVMLKHIQWAKQAGIDGFIVSWKSTDTLNPRLEQLVELSEKEDFKLMVIYQGLSYERRPRPIRQVQNDFDYFIKNFASSSAFDVFSKPVIIWNGTWEYSLKDIESVTGTRRQKLLILATQKNADDYTPLADLVDGDAYYWSSVNPYSTPNFQEKLAEMGKVVHEHGGIWLPSAATGYDARKIGGRRVVPRNDGQTFELLMQTAYKSSPDAIGLISWNEFSENTHIEPSEKHGLRYLEMLAQIFKSPPPPAPDLFESDEPYPAANPSPVAESSMTGKSPLRLEDGRVSSVLFLITLIGISSIILFVRHITRN